MLLILHNLDQTVLGHVSHIGMASWMLAALSVVAAMAQIDVGVPTPQRTQIPASGGTLPQLDLFTSFVNISMTATELEVGETVQVLLIWLDSGFGLALSLVH